MEEESDRMVNEEQLEKAYQKGKVVFNKLMKDEYMRIASEFSDDQAGEETKEDKYSSSSEDEDDQGEETENEDEKNTISIKQARRHTKWTRTVSKTTVMVINDMLNKYIEIYRRWKRSSFPLFI